MIALDPAWVAPDRTALLIVDMQADFAVSEGAMGRAGADLSGVPAALAAAQRLSDRARTAGVAVIFVGLQTAPGADLLSWREEARRRGEDPEQAMALCREGTAGAAFVGPQPQPGERIVAKRRYSGFLGTDLEAMLRESRIDTVIVCGLTTECCVALTALDAFQRGFHGVVVSDASAAYGAEVHSSALKALQMNGVWVRSSAELAAALA